MKNIRTFSLAASLMFAGTASARADYTFTTINDPAGGASTHLTEISGNTVIGYSLARGFSETGGVFTTVADPLANPLWGPALLGASTQPMGISGGTIVGFYYGADDLMVHGFTETNGVYTTLDNPLASAGDGAPVGGTFLTGISGSTIIGYYTDASDNAHGFSEAGGVFTPLADNNPGHFAFPSNTVTSTKPTGISGNNVVGLYEEDYTAFSGFTETDGVYADVDILASGVSGDSVVGWYPGVYAQNYAPQGYIEAGGVKTLIDDPSVYGPDGGTWPTAVDGTTVVGYYASSVASYGGFIATLVPEPSSIALLALGIFPLLRRRKSASR
jgi:hypothetical protein